MAFVPTQQELKSQLGRRVAHQKSFRQRFRPVFGHQSPSVDAVVRALTFRCGIRLQPSGGYAANLLGLSDQVPMRIVFLTDGRNRRIQVGKLQIIFKRTAPRNMATAGKTSGLVIQALRYLGPGGRGRHQIIRC